MAADYMEAMISFRDERNWESVAEHVSETLGVRFSRTPAPGLDAYPEHDQMVAHALGMSWSISPDEGRYLLVAATKSVISTGAEGRLRLDDAIRTLLLSAGFHDVRTREDMETPG